jgi:hypothetical protein
VCLGQGGVDKGEMRCLSIPGTKKIKATASLASLGRGSEVQLHFCESLLVSLRSDPVYDSGLCDRVTGEVCRKEA